MKSIIVMLTVLLLLGCGARKKEVHKTETQTDYRAHFDSMVHLMEQTKSQSLKIQASLLQQHNMHIEYDGASGDSLDIKQYGSDGKAIGGIIIKGKGKAVITDNQKQEQHQEQQAYSTENKKQLKAEGNKDVSYHTSAESLDKNKWSFNPTLLWLLLIPAILIWRWYKNKRGLI